ncbi:LysR family transcriptional regulator [Pollutimonas thiosulfatoxidans]|uniref:LysR family transcriptional regulator n=1 Tax=Pollutimonas thiosulfatoxidans TaxID=2028345 RepID=A0A410GBE5_9BURK|nr:LysR family transcriptional regulator [Pollutimonas thiosulfatoxidans]MBF6617391.1 LysR family transcriptional regulator [Candidimonas sp.]NYT46202.1 LysR family transcriptional regulator [Alcaligenaceae bacterium]QAA93609.1 LysR family transcriptional regulator [Pollutimonas thiosulfatoxidans]
MDKFKQLESFVAVATLGSLTAAARAEGVAPAMMSRRLTALEGRLGVKLLLRSTRRLSLTSEGTALLEEAQRILRDLNDTEARITQGSVKPGGHLRVSAPAGFGRRHVAPLLPEFTATYPDVSVTLDLSDRLVDLIEERYDCAIRLGELDDSQIVGLRLADNQRVIVAAPSYLERHGRPATPDDLARHNCLSFGNQGNQARGWLLRQNGQLRAIRAKGSLACSDGSVLHQWTLAGIGLSWRSLWEVRDDLAAGRLLTVLDDYAAPPNGIFAMLPERKHLPLRVRLFVDMLKERYATPSYWAATDEKTTLAT